MHSPLCPTGRLRNEKRRNARPARRRSFRNDRRRKTRSALHPRQQYGFTVQITNFGARVVSILAPDRNGRMADVAVGCESIGRYLDEGEAASRDRRGTLRKPHRRGSLHARRHAIPTAAERQRTVIARRRERARQPRMDRRFALRRFDRHALRVARRRRGVSRRTDRTGDLRRHRRQRPQDRLPRTDRPPHRRQPLEPHALQPRWRGQRHDTRSRTVDRRRGHNTPSTAC